jgi:hypothetical protein
VQIEQSDDARSLTLHIYEGLDTHINGSQHILITFELTTTMFRLQTIAVLLSFAAQALSIGCEYIGLDTFKEDLTKKIITQLDPLVEDPNFETIDPYQCYWRIPRTAGKKNDAGKHP